MQWRQSELAQGRFGRPKDLQLPMLKRLITSPIAVRVLPFAALALLTLLRGQWGDVAQYWIYSLEIAAGAIVLLRMRPYIREMQWRFSWEAAAVGGAVFLVWVGLDGHYPFIVMRDSTFNPERTFGSGSPMTLAFISVRLLGSSFIVPPIEEIFYRSFLHRYLIKSDFLKIPLDHFEWLAFVISAVIFGISHHEWLPGILCGFAYQGLIIRKKRLGDAISAHAITNFLLGLWIIFRKAYFFW
jgi:uncharacterized protein